MVFLPSFLNLGEFIIIGNGCIVFVRVRLARKLYASIQGIEAEFSDAITGLGLVPRGGQVSCELWLYSRYGTLRHFRLGETGLVEIDCYGKPLAREGPVVTGPAVGGKPGVPGPAGTGPVDTRGPILRWLAKRNAGRKLMNGSAAIGPALPEKITAADKPVTGQKGKAGRKPVVSHAGLGGVADPGKSTDAGTSGAGDIQVPAAGITPSEILPGSPGAPPVNGPDVSTVPRKKGEVT
jgi:hypothetical protein